MKDAPTLLDAAVRESYKPRGKVPAEVRPLLVNAKKFILDDEMSGFLSELSHTPFEMGAQRSIQTIARRTLLMDQLRYLARLPHAITYIEYNPKATKQYTLDKFGSKSYEMTGGNASVTGTIPRIGWLMIQHSQVDTAFLALIIAEFEHTAVCPLAFGYCWSSEDKPLPWHTVGSLADGTYKVREAEVMTGVLEYQSPYIGLVPSQRGWGGTKEFNSLEYFRRSSVQTLLLDFTGEYRRMISLLATINELPLKFTSVRASKGYVARGQYRKYLDHTTITLSVPGHKNIAKIISKAIAIARRRAHQVRGHWRKDHWHPGERTWIKEHQRGDASLGFVTHDYKLTHNDKV